MLVEQSVGSNTNNAWTLPLAIHSWHVATKPLWWWGWAHWIVFMTSLYMYYSLCFVHLEHSCVSWTNFSFNQYIYAPSLVPVEHSVGSNTNNVWTPPLAVHSQHVATKPLWWWGGWAHWNVFMTSLYIYIYIYITNCIKQICFWRRGKNFY